MPHRLDFGRNDSIFYQLVKVICSGTFCNSIGNPSLLNTQKGLTVFLIKFHICFRPNTDAIEQIDSKILNGTGSGI